MLLSGHPNTSRESWRWYPNVGDLARSADVTTVVQSWSPPARLRKKPGTDTFTDADRWYDRYQGACEIRAAAQDPSPDPTGTSRFFRSVQKASHDIRGSVRRR
ncbi:hypothetical protein MBOT_01330 [Mycobacterium botniense]|uniref:Uncharacterized protein n=1 Tax=Mycobacterium botniense TaxID=84962 RepID=A0A7I9XSM0_9MYCO|nr:hypothetical protein MBOT_01330 [Mycobacterium botniense]